MSHQDVTIKAAAAGSPPGAPTAPTSITKDAGATVSFLAPSSSGSSSITSYTVTPYVAGVAQSPTTVPVGSLGSITGSDGNTYKKADVTGLTNGTAYTFTVKATNSNGTGSESTASGANTPLSGLVFGDDFNGPANGAIDPEWWVYSPRCGYLKQSEIQGYDAAHCVLDGSGNLALIAEHTPWVGTSYPSDGNRSVTQPWTSGACQSNTRTYHPSAGNTMTFETRFQVPPDSGNGFWPGLLWLEGQDFLEQWKTDPDQPGWDNAGKAEIDIAEWANPTALGNYGCSTDGNTDVVQHITTSIDFSASMHVFSCQWKPGVSVKFFRDGTQTGSTVTTSGVVPSSSTNFFLLLYLQMIFSPPTTTERCSIDYVRVYDQNLG